MNFHLLLDAEGRIAFFNNSFQAWSGYHLSELQQKPIQNYLLPTYAQLVNNFLSEPYFQDSLNLPRIAFFCKDAVKWAGMVLTCLPQQGNNSHTIMISLSDVTKQAQQEMDEVKQTHASFFEGHPFGVLRLNNDGEVTNINPQLYADAGYNLAVLQQTAFVNFVLTKYRQRVLREYVNTTKFGKGSTFDIQILTAQQQPLDVNLTMIPVIYHGKTIETYLVVKNIAERIALQQNLKKLSLVADKATNGVAVLDKNFEIELINDGFTQMSGYTRMDAIGKGLGELLKMDETDTEVAKVARQKMANGLPLEGEVLCYKKDGTSYWNLLRLAPVLNEEGEMEMCITIHSDITEKRKTEMELRLLADDLYRQNKELHQFAYIVSHNLRSPVANIVGLINLMELFKDDSETLNQTLKELSKSASNLDTVIKDLSYILTVNNASKELLKEPVNLQDTLQQVLIDLQPQILMTDADVKIPVKPVVMRTNRAYLHSIFYNLISNAIKYKSHQTPYIKIDYYLTDEHTVIYVADNGKGIDLNKHGHELFKPYKRFDFKVEGKGLGLFLVKSHIEALGGHLTVKSEVKKGSTFYMKIPFA
ncbi:MULTISPECIES: PAS domain-containing protein [unclassified Mucilaginibacter]|uniref:PAS domain-containing sensor histidine kinase n=1 Tax=unclassified Mucilaginibacter TaxID=2617802 RepID=UPI0031F61D39